MGLLATHPKAQGLCGGGLTPGIRLLGEGPSHFETVSLGFLPGRQRFTLEVLGTCGGKSTVLLLWPHGMKFPDCMLP